MQRRDLVDMLRAAGFHSCGGTKHDKFTNGSLTVMVPRHREIKESTARMILRQAGLR